MNEDDLKLLLEDIREEWEARPPEDRADLIECIRESADLGSF